ncbi:MAG: hypothetical protein IJU37_11780 [Desulfovibrio sp.]|nr:hypothetical protein [Desulfovibrio sp.]
MISDSFEFLASEPEWENACKQNPKKIDALPQAFRTAEGGAWTFAAQLLATLAPFSSAEFKIGTYKQSLASLAKDGSPKDGIQGFPGLLKNAGANANEAWRQLAEPVPALLEDLPHGSLLLRLQVELLSPFYSRDDMPFYPTENVLKRHKVFDLPYLPSSSVKGLLRWADRMVRMDTKDDAKARVLFGSVENEDGTEAHDVQDDTHGVGLQGALYCYPVFWNGTVGLEVINPQDAKTGAGSVPIKYEVLKAGGTASLFFLLANLPGRQVPTTEHVDAFLKALGFLLRQGGLSAKSSAGWGRVRLIGANAALRGQGQRFAATAPARTSNLVQQAYDKSANDAWAVFVGSDGELLPLAGNETAIFTNRRIKDVLGPECSGKMLKDKAACYEKIQKLFAERRAAPTQSLATEKTTEWLWPDDGLDDMDAFASQVLDVFKECKKKEA